jgi:PleD family two-component response regulator
MPSRTLEVLLVDNHEADAQTVSGFAAELNHRRQEREGLPQLSLTRVTRLAEARCALARQPYDAILVDLALPDSFALHTYRALAAGVPFTPILILTRSEDDVLASRAIAEGAQDYLIKGQLAGLGRALRFAIERHRLSVAYRDASFLDPLSGLFSFRGYLSVGEILLETARRAGHAVALALLEIDNLDALQQAGGQDEADRLALDCAGALRQTFHPADLLARPAPGSFAALVVDGARDGLVALRARLHAHLPAPDPQRTLPSPLLSVGAALACPGSPTGPEDLILQARLHLAQNEFHPARLAAGGM